jgi:hypothetical protein
MLENAQKITFFVWKMLNLALFFKKENLFKNFFRLVLPYVFRKFSKNLAKNIGGPRHFCRVYKNFSKIILTLPTFFAPTGAKIFVEYIFFSLKTLRNFRRKFCWNLWVNTKISAAGENFFEKRLFICWKWSENY